MATVFEPVRKQSRLDQDVAEFLNDLRESGETNMFGAAPYLQEELGFGRQEARDTLMDWMEQFEG